MEDPPSDEEGAAQRQTAKKCFTNVQQRRFWAPLSTVRLCPSMDLIAYGLQKQQPSQSIASNTASALHIHRTLNWQQKIAHVAAPVAASPEKLPLRTTKDDESAATTTISKAHHAEWRPDGRLLAVAAGKAVSLYSLEGLLKATGTQDPHSGEDAATGKIHTCTLLPDSSSITALSWVHVGCEHASWPDAETSDFDNNNSSVQQLQTVDRLQYVLPPSEYHGSGRIHSSSSDDHYHDEDVLPTSQTPLSLLCVSTTTGTTGLLHLFLHGRYAVAYNLHLPATATTTSIVACTDLTHLIAASVNAITVLSIPALAKHRYDLQTVSAQYCKVMQHLEAVRSSLPEITASWKSSLKAVDLKLDGLFQLLQNYGLVSSSGKTDDDTTAENNKTNASMRSLLVQYILSGHTRTAPNLSNAIDQFFTGVQMNDQLVQRMERSLAGAVANVESTVRKQLLAPATALVYEIDQLYGLASYRSDLLSATVTLQFLHSAQQLLLSIETALTALVEARGRLRDFCAWLRCTGAQIKARGTAANSVQRENAKKRRIPATVVSRMLSYLQQGQATDAHCGGGTTETVLNLRFADLLRESSVPVATNLRPVSPASVRKLTVATLTKTTPTVPHVLEETSVLAGTVFEYPRQFLAQSIQRTEIRLLLSDKILAVTTRLGQGGIDPDQVTYGEDRPEGFFSPRSSSDDSPAASDFRQWSVVAQAIVKNSVQLHAFPLTWTKNANDEFDDDESDVGLASEFDWTARLSLPSEYSIRDIAFYGDDGKSSLSSGVDSGSGQEGRQRLGLLVSRKRTDGDAQQPETTTEAVELWLLPYDKLNFVCLPLQKERTLNSLVFHCGESNNPVIPKFAVSPMPESDEGEREATSLEDCVVYARTREVFPAVDFSAENNRPCHLVLSGSRGIGAVVVNQQAGTVLEVLDLEEDEEEDEVEAMDAEDEDE